MKRCLIFIFLSTVLASTAFSQSNARARKLYDEALKYRAQKKYTAAAEAMEQAIKQDPAYTDAQSTLAQWYFSQHQFEEAKAVLTNAFHHNKSFAYPYAKSLVYTGNPTTALGIINSYLSTGRKEWQQLLKQTLFVQQALRHPWNDSIRNLGRPNTPDAELYPWLTADSNKLFFTRRINNIDEDFFMTSLDSCGGWFTGTNLGKPPNSPDQESAQMISADGHYLFYTKCDNRSQNGWAQGGCDLYMSYRVHDDSAWSVPQSFGATINTPGYEGMGCLSADNRTLYFVSDREGGYGGLDIWMTHFENGRWQAPKNLGASINTAFDETTPFLHIDNRTFFFSSTRPEGMGGSDLFMSRKTNDTTWAPATNLGYPINTAFDEASACVSGDGSVLFFSSDRDSVAGNFDIYETQLPQTMRPYPVAVLKGHVYDSFSKARLNYAVMNIKDAATGAELFHFQSNRGDGSFMITLLTGRKYLCHTDRVSYKDHNDTLDLTEPRANEQFNYQVALLPYDYVAPVHDSLIFTIYFKKNMTAISDSVASALTEALIPWLENKESTQVYINGYTDNSGTPLINEQISYTRAGIVAEAVLSFGFYEMNIHAQGWGEANAVAPNDTEENQNLNRRVEIVIRR